jgi:flagellar hook assembly protein FlgD
VTDAGVVGTKDAATTDSGTSTGGPTLTITATSSQTASPQFAPKNVVAVWVEGAAFVKTIQRWSATRTNYLLAWKAAAGAGDVDAVSGATRSNHATALTINWDLKGKNGVVIPDGTYTVHMESADRNSSAVNQNNEGTFTFVKGPNMQSQTGLSNGGFSNVSITYKP